MEYKNQRACIVGTAQSWKRCPWNDPSLHIAGLNDAYQLKGWQRADSWYDLHPPDKWFYPETQVPGFTKRNPKQVYAHELPPGHYVRPAVHPEKLRTMNIPLWLQSDPPAGWLHAKKFPKEEIEAHFGRYFGSTPSWILAHLIMRGIKDVAIYGIHLATEFEYVQQRPNFEFLIGRVLGAGKVTETIKDGMRHYETADGHIALPVESPILQAKYQYAYQAKPDPWIAPLQWELQKIQIKRARAVKKISALPFWQRQEKSSTSAEIARYDALAADYQQQIARLQIAAQMG